MYIHIGTAWWLKGHNPGLKGFRCVQLHNVWWQQIPIPHCSWEKGHLSGVNTTGFQLKCPVVCISRALTRWYQSVFFGDGYQLSINFVHHHQSCIFFPVSQRSPFESLEHVDDTRLVSLVADDISRYIQLLFFVRLQFCLFLFPYKDSKQYWHIQPTGEQAFGRLVL